MIKDIRKLYKLHFILKRMSGVCINKSEIEDLVRLTKEINDRIESLELMSNKKLMKSFKKAKEQVKKRDFEDWNVL